MTTPITSHDELHAKIDELLHTIGTMSCSLIEAMGVPTIELRYVATLGQCELQVWIGGKMIASQEVKLP